MLVGPLLPGYCVIVTPGIDWVAEQERTRLIELTKAGLPHNWSLRKPEPSA